VTIEQIQQNINEVEQNLHTHNYAEAEVQAQSLLNEAMIEENSELQAQLLFIIGDSLLRRGLSKDALPYFERTARIAENNAIKSLQLKVFGSLGIVYETLADFAQCMEYYEKALELSQEIDDERSTAKNYVNIGIVHYTLGNYIKSLEYFRKALDINEKIHNNQGIMSALVNIGSLYARLNDYPKALEYYDRGIVLNEMVGNTMGVAILLTNMGNVYKNMSSFSPALECLNKALILCEQIDNKEGSSIIFDSIGMVYADQSQYSQALSYFEKSLAINEELGNHVAIAESFGNIARLMTNVDYEGYSKEKAEYYYEKALALSNELKLQDHLCFLHKSVAKFYKHEKDWEKYSYHIEQYHTLEKEVQSEEVKKQAERLDYERKVAEREKQIAVERAKHEAIEELLYNVLPQSITKRLLNKEQPIADKVENVSVFFSDIVGFTTLSQKMSAKELVSGLNELFIQYDILAKKHGLEKIKTIGDAYMAVCGVPVFMENHAERTAAFALEIQDLFKNRITIAGHTVNVRIGLHCGEVVAGVIGEQKFAYDLWGDAVNTASRMESHGEAGKIHVSEEFVRELGMRNEELRMKDKELTGDNSQFIICNSQFIFVPRGEIDIKGKGMMRTYFLEKLSEQDL
jgi:adenylate cyclase